MAIKKARCAVCGENPSLKGQTVSCNARLKRGSHTTIGSLAQTILAIETQAVESDQTLDISSIATDGRGYLTFSVKTLVGGSFASAPGDLNEGLAVRCVFSHNRIWVAL